MLTLGSGLSMNIGVLSATLGRFDVNTLSKSGGQLFGPLVLAADPVHALEVAIGQCIDVGKPARVQKTGYTVTGARRLLGNPTLVVQAVFRQDVNAGLSAPLARSSMSI